MSKKKKAITSGHLIGEFTNPDTIARDKVCSAVWFNLLGSPHPVACDATPDAIINALKESQWAVSVPDDACEGGKLAAIVVALKDSPYALSAAQLAV